MSARWLILVALALLTGCQSAGLLRSDDGLSYRVTGVELLQPLTVAPDTTRVFIQDGQVLGGGAKGGSYRTRCAFELRDRLETAQVIEPARFSVIRVQGLMNEVVQAQPVLVAGLKLVGMDDGGSPMVHLGYHFWFEPNPADVRRMTCYGTLEVMTHVEDPTLDEIRRTLDGVARVSFEQR